MPLSNGNDFPARRACLLGMITPICHRPLVLEKSQGLVLRVVRLTETSLIVRWWTLEHGRIDTVAKGARRNSSAFAGKIDLFFSAEITWQRSKSGPPHHLRESSVSNYREGLRKSYVNTLMAGYFCGLIEKIHELEHAEPQVHDLLGRALDHVATSGASLRALRFFEQELARLHGVGSPGVDVQRALLDMGAGLPDIRRELLERLSR